MLVFGESILNDAVSIVLTTTIVESGDSEVQDSSMAYQVGAGIGRWFHHILSQRRWTISVRRQCANLGSLWCSLALLELGHWWQCWVHLSWNTLTCTQTQGADIPANTLTILTLSLLASNLASCCASHMYLTHWQRYLDCLQISYVTRNPQINDLFPGLTLEWNNGNSLLWHCHVPLHPLQSIPSNTGTLYYSRKRLCGFKILILLCR